MKPKQWVARVAGFLFLFLIIVAVYGEFYLLDGVIVDDYSVTAKNIVDNANIFRIAVATELIAFVAAIPLAVALYVIFRPVNKNLALLAAFWRLGEASVLGVILLNRFMVLRLLSGAEYLSVFDKEQLYALVGVFLDAYDIGYGIGVIFFGLGSTVFSYLFFKSRYIPRPLSLLGIFGSSLIFLFTFANFILPDDAALSFPAVIPILVFELTLGFWLMIKGINVQQEDGTLESA